MTFIDDIELVGIKKGRLNNARESVLEALEIRFGAFPQAIKEAIERVPDLETCKRLHQLAIQA